jgi:hypothetical protein
MYRVLAAVLTLGIVGNAWCDDDKTTTPPKVISKTTIGTKLGEVAKISTDSVTLKIHEQSGTTGSGKSARPKMETKEHTYPIDEKTKVKFNRVKDGDPKELTPKIDEIPVGDKITVTLSLVKSKGSDNKITEETVVTAIEVTQKPKKKDSTSTTTSKP